MSAALLISLPLMANQFNSAGIFGCAIIYDFYSFAMNEIFLLFLFFYKCRIFFTSVGLAMIA